MEMAGKLPTWEPRALHNLLDEHLGKDNLFEFDGLVGKQSEQAAKISEINGAEIGPGKSWQRELFDYKAKSLREQFQSHEGRDAEMFLRPMQAPKGEKILQIVNFIDNLVPKDNEWTISENGQSRLVISYGQRKPRLESVTLTQWVKGNTRIFHHLLFSGKLPTAVDISEYLVYTVKIMEFAIKYEWVSVLKYDDEFCQLQGIYGYPWNYDCSTLLVTLVPKPPSNSHKSKFSPQVP